MVVGMIQISNVTHKENIPLPFDPIFVLCSHPAILPLNSAGHCRGGSHLKL